MKFNFMQEPMVPCKNLLLVTGVPSCTRHLVSIQASVPINLIEYFCMGSLESSWNTWASVASRPGGIYKHGVQLFYQRIFYKKYLPRTPNARFARQSYINICIGSLESSWNTWLCKHGVHLFYQRIFPKKICTKNAECSLRSPV